MRVKKEITQFYNKLSMKVNLLAEINTEKYNLNYKSHIYEIKKAMTETSTSAHLEVFI